jgi:hypothetical protein
MALKYFLYNTDYNDTVVDSSNSSFSPVAPYEEIYIDFLIPETQPYYFYANSGGTGGTIIVNTQANIDAYLSANVPSPLPYDNITYGEFTGVTQNLQTQIDGLTGLTTGLTLQQVTTYGAITDVESTFSSGLITPKLNPTGETIQIGTTPFITINTTSGLTGYNIEIPIDVIHIYGTDTNNTDPLGLQKNSITLDGVAGADKSITWAEDGVVNWLAQTYRDENSRFWLE